VAPIPCGGAVDSGAPQITILKPTDGALYVTSLPVDVRMTDGDSIRHIDVFVDGKKVWLPSVRNPSDASITCLWGKAKGLAYGPHTLVVTARDAAQNVGRASVRFVHVGGGRYPYRVGTSLALRLGKVKSGRVSLRGKVTPLGGITPLAYGRVQVEFQRFDTHAKRWVRVARFSKDAKRAFRLSYRFSKRGLWRATGVFKPTAGFKGSRAQTPQVRF
jgi:hypothetical protein